MRGCNDVGALAQMWQQQGLIDAHEADALRRRLSPTRSGESQLLKSLPDSTNASTYNRGVPLSAPIVPKSSSPRISRHSTTTNMRTTSGAYPGPAITGFLEHSQHILTSSDKLQDWQATPMALNPGNALMERGRERGRKTEGEGVSEGEWQRGGGWGRKLDTDF